MASTALVAVAVGGGISLGLVASSSVASCSLRAAGDSRRLGRRLVILRRGGTEGQRMRGRNCPKFHCANEVDVVTEDDSVDGDATDDEADLEAAADDAIDADVDTEDELDSSLPEDFEWIKQQPLPYPLDALEPYISKETVEQHWGVHQQIHVDQLNGMIGGSEWEGMSLGQMMLASFNEGREEPHPPFFHAAQVWNHDFYWRSMKPGGGGKPPERLLKFINRDFGSYEGMIRQFMDAALTQFGSGWVWLSYKGSGLPYVKSRSPIPSDNYGRLVISKTPNAINPLVWGHSPLLAIDVWEHAYYLDYEDRRADYVSAILENLVSWEIVESRLTKAVVRAVERDEHLRRRILWKQRLAQANGQSRGRPRTRQGRPTGRQGDQEVARSSPVEA
ncbi:superoxide dismutase [Fe] 1, chloroplastic-like isoform X1 [Miscanthus floridulus]|uniref:superoxide dismutase [Fe] 1, chloroplastic-like isoform X1 n=1 Tax=Miscanthus floridulus TaxID=154761 RepID=UPI003458F927